MRWTVKYKQEIRNHPAVKPLLLRLKEKGWKIEFVRWINKQTDGCCNAKQRKIYVCASTDREIYYPRSIKKVAWILAHEYRHAWQADNKKYLDYIYCRNDKEKEIAEKDADDFADRYIKNFWP